MFALLLTKKTTKMKDFSYFKDKSLGRKEMRAVKGGFGTCAAKSPSGHVHYNLSKAQAHLMASGGNWCCDSCSSASWY